MKKKMSFTPEKTIPAQWLIKKGKLISPPGFGQVSLYEVIRFFQIQVRTIGMTERASAIAFNFVMAIPPAIIFLFTLLPHLPISQSFQQELYFLIKNVVPGEKENAVLVSFLQDFINNPRNGLLSLGFILSLYFSSNAMMGIMRSFDKNYHGFTKRKRLKTRLIALKITALLYLVVLSCLAILVVREAALHWLGITNENLIFLINNLRWLVIVLLFFFCISFIYKHAPSVQKKWKLINPGSVLATLLMLLTTLALSWWVSNFGQYNQVYGSISTVLVIMILIFINSLILLTGFELNVSIQTLRNRAKESAGPHGPIP